MKRVISALLSFVLLVCLFGCSKEAESESTTETTLSASTVNDTALEALREKYPEYFEIGSFKGVEVYVWKMSDTGYRCGILSGTNRNKWADEIHSLYTKSITPSECRLILDSLGISAGEVVVYPVTQPLSDYYYEMNDNVYTQLCALFPDYHVSEAMYTPDINSFTEVQE